MGLQVYSAHLSYPLCALKILYLGQCVILGSVSRTAAVGVTYQLFAVAICHSHTQHLCNPHTRSPSTGSTFHSVFVADSLLSSHVGPQHKAAPLTPCCNLLSPLPILLVLA